MEYNSCNYGFGFLMMIFIFFSGLISLMVPPVGAYKNYTVGDTLGWYDTLEKPGVDYQKWVAGKTFSLGDFLIFNSDTNHTIVQTYNATTYKLCDYEDSSDNDTIQWSSDNPSNTLTHAVTVAVPLLKEGATFFFSSDYDGEQCQNGQRFQINVTHGQGLPKSLIPDNELAPGPDSRPYSGGTDDETAPDTIVPANFDHPKEDQTDDDDNVPSGAQTVLNLKDLDIGLSCLLGFLLQVFVL